MNFYLYLLPDYKIILKWIIALHLRTKTIKDLIKIKNSHLKDNIKKKKKTTTNYEKICSKHKSDEGLVSQI